MRSFNVNRVAWDGKREVRIDNIPRLDKNHRDFIDYIVENGHCSPDFLIKSSKKYKSSRELIKASFGSQMVCKNYSNHRVWIWSMSDWEGKADLYLMYSVKGMGFSYKDGSSTDEVVKLYKEVVDCMSNFLNK